MMIVDQVLLIILFITPGLIITSFFNLKKEYLLTLCFSIFFWCLSSIFIPMNFFVVNIYGNFIIYFAFLFWIIKFKNFKNLIFNFIFLLLFENINNFFGVIHITSTTQITLDSALSNLSFNSYNPGVSSMQIALLKFFNKNFILLTLQQCVSFSLLFFNLKNIIKLNHLKYFNSFIIFPAFLIIAVLLEIMTIRTHFFASQLLCFLIIEAFKLKSKRLPTSVFLIFLCMFISSRLENIIIYFPLILLVLRNYFNDEILIKNKKMVFMLLLSTFSPLIINFYAYTNTQDLRGNIFILSFLIILLNIFVIFNKNNFIKFIHNKFNLIFIFSVILLAIALHYLFSNKAMNSWLLIFNHLVDSHQGWGVVVFYFVIILIYLINKTENYELKKMYTTFFITFALIIISSPLQHSSYGGESWIDGIIEGLAIYNPYDESQTRSFLQLFLTILPFSVLITSPKTNI